MAGEDKSVKGGKLDYEGELAEPLEPLVIGCLADEDFIRAKTEERACLIDRKMNLLVDHFQIKRGPNQWYHLAYELAKQIVPGFKERVPKGRPPKWTDYELAILYVEVRRQIEEKGCGDIKTACGNLAQEYPWTELLSSWRVGLNNDGPDPGAALYEKHKAAKRLDRRYLTMLRDLYRLTKETSNAEDWQQLLNAVVEGKK